jgi:hypothetical protein
MTIMPRQLALRFDIGLMAGAGPADRHRAVGQIGGVGK